MKFLLTPIGSHGDVHPFAALARELARRGHDVAVATNENFRPLIERMGVRYIQQGSVADYQEILQSPEIWHATKGPRWLFALLVEKPLRDLYQIIADHAGREKFTLVAPPIAFAARVAHDRLGVPLATIHLAPSSLRSVMDPAILPGLPMPPWTPLWLRRSMFWFADVAIADPICAPMNRFRKQLGLPAARRILDQWWNSPQRIIGLFPEWFATARDWPPQTRLTGFPLFDEREDHVLAADIAAFLAEGEAPLVFTPGSANAQGAKFFQAAVEACRLLQRRALFLTGHVEHLPRELPTSIQHARYIPFSHVLPRAEALIHHGGIGTTAQALAAGIPQLIMPLGFDQMDNAARCARLGVARSLPPARFTGVRVAQRLRELLTPDVQQRCREVALRLANNDGVARTCDLIEESGESRNISAQTFAPRSPGSR